MNLHESKPKLSQMGIQFLSDPVMRAALSVIAEEVNVTPEEYLLRFEEVMTENEEALLGIFGTLTTYAAEA